MAKAPKFSVVVPAYNCARFLPETVESILRQSERDLELIIVDDGSADDTLAIARGFAERDPRVRILTRVNSGRPAIARNDGIRIARGELIAFLDGDDLYAPERLRRVADAFERIPGLDFLFHDVTFIDEGGAKFAETLLASCSYVTRARAHLEPVGDHLYRCRESFYAFMATELAGTHTSAVTVRAATLHAMPYWFFEDLTLMEDYDLWFRLVHSGSAGFLDLPLSAYRQYGSSISSRKEQFATDQLRAHLRNYERGRRRFSMRQRLRYLRKIAGMQGAMGYRDVQRGHVREGRSAFLKSLAILPTPTAAFAWMKSWLPGWLRDRARAARSGERGDLR